MGFDINNTKLLPFLVGRETIEKEFVRWSAKKEDSPLDIIENSKVVEISKLYIPVRKFYDIKYSACWSAISFWTHSEAYTEYESKIVYIDRWGGEHDTKSSAELFGGQGFNAQAVSKNVPVTRYRTVVDRTERTRGKVYGETEDTYVDTHSERTNECSEWIAEIIKKNESYVKDFQQNTQDSPICDLFGEDDDAFLIIMDKTLAKTIAEHVKSEIPGDSYQDCEVFDENDQYKVSFVLTPIYRIKYTYNNQEYQYYVDGTNAENIFMDSYPVDESFVMACDKIQAGIKEKEDAENVCGGVLILDAIVFGFSVLSLWIFELGKTMHWISLIVAAIALYAMKKANDRKKELNKALDTLRSKRELRRNGSNKVSEYN